MGVRNLNEFLNGVSILTILGSLAGFLPPFAALLAAGYYMIQIYESDTLKRWRARRRVGKLEKLKAKVAALEVTTVSVAKRPPSPTP